MNTKDSMIMQSYRRQKPGFVKLEGVAENILKETVKELNINVLLIEHRVKTEESLKGKLYKKGDGYKTLEDITDILGVRVICFFSDDVDKIGAEIEKKFVIDWQNSGDKRAMIKADSFGYLSLHYICSIAKDSGYPDEICGKKFEIQIRTGLQHIWASIDHDIAYKNKYGVPRAITREFSRLAGLLELADDEFVRLRNDMNSYSDDIHCKIMDDTADEIDINIISFKEYMLYNKSMRNYLSRLSKTVNAGIVDVNPESYIDQLVYLGIRELGAVSRMIEEDGDLAIRLAKYFEKETNPDIISSNSALKFLCRAEILKRGYTKSEAAEFINISVKDDEISEKQANRLFETYALIGKESI